MRRRTSWCIADVRSGGDTPQRPVPRTMTAARRQTVFAGLDPPRAWPPTPRALRPQRLQHGLDSLPGVAAATERKLGRLGLATVRDVLEHAPFRFVEPTTIADLFGDTEEVAINVE